MYGMSARRPDARSCAKRSATRSDEVVADTNSVPIGLVRLDDGSLEGAVLTAIGEIDKVTGEQNIPSRVAHDAHDRSRKHLRDRIARVHQAQLECIEDHERTDGKNAGEIYECFDQDGIHPGTFIVSH